MKLLHLFFCFTCFFVGESSFAQGTLRPCTGNFISSDWSNCYGSFDWGSYVYTGGFLKNVPHGWGEKKRHGGKIIVTGIWEEGVLKENLSEGGAPPKEIQLVSPSIENQRLKVEAEAQKENRLS